jgi:hypothetical protein
LCPYTGPYPGRFAVFSAVAAILVPVPSPNVELARQAYAAINRRDVEWLIERSDPDIEPHMRGVAEVPLFVGARGRLRGRASAIDVENKTASVYRLRDGVVTEIRSYRDVEEALAAAGLV